MNIFPKKMYRIKFDVENTPSNVTVCLICSKGLEKGEIRLTIRRFMKQSEYFHLSCCGSRFKQYIVKRDLNISLKGEDLIFFYDWLNNWNKNYYPLDYTPINIKIPSQSLNLVTVSKKRLFIEIFKFLNVRDILCSILYVNKEFYQVSWSKELWQSLLIRDFKYKKIVENPKEKYSERFSLVCRECFKLTSQSNFYRCPLLKKTFCNNCIELPKYSILNKTDIKKIFDIDAGKLNLEYFKCDECQKVTYIFMVKKALEKYRIEQKQKVLGMIQLLGNDHPAFRDVHAINIYEMDALAATKNWKGFPIHVSKLGKDCKLKWYKKIYEFIRRGIGSFDSENKIVSKIIEEFKKINKESKT